MRHYRRHAYSALGKQIKIGPSAQRCSFVHQASRKSMTTSSSPSLPVLIHAFLSSALPHQLHLLPINAPLLHTGATYLPISSSWYPTALQVRHSYGSSVYLDNLVSPFPFNSGRNCVTSSGYIGASFTCSST